MIRAVLAPLGNARDKHGDGNGAKEERTIAINPGLNAALRAMTTPVDAEEVCFQEAAERGGDAGVKKKGLAGLDKKGGSDHAGPYIAHMKKRAAELRLLRSVGTGQGSPQQMARRAQRSPTN